MKNPTLPLLLTDSDGENRRVIIRRSGEHDLDRLECPYRGGRCSSNCAAFATRESETSIEFVCRAFGRVFTLGVADPERWDFERLEALKLGTVVKENGRGGRA